MGQNDNNEREGWARLAIQTLVEGGLSDRAVATAFISYFASAAPSRRQYVDLLSQVAVLAEGYQADINAEEAAAEAEAAEVPDEPPAEVIEVMKMLGIDPTEVKAAFIGRPTGQKAAPAAEKSKCDCDVCVIKGAGAIPVFFLPEIPEA